MKLCLDTPLVRAGLALLLGLLAGPAFAASLWLGGLDPVTAKTPTDFMALFAPNAPWDAAAHKLAAFKLSTQFVLGASDDQLKTVLAGLKARGLAVAVELGVLFDPVCGKQVEGYASPATAKSVAERIKAHGGALGFVALDEQLWFGHFDKSPRACRFAIAEIARQVAARTKEIEAVFPGVKIGAIEPVSSDLKLDDVKTYLDAYRAASGAPFDFIHADVQWSRPWKGALSALAGLAKARGIGFGVIVDSDRGDDKTGQAWNAHAMQDYRAVLALKPEVQTFIVQSWTKEPHDWLPESSPDALTHLVGELR